MALVAFITSGETEKWSREREREKTCSKRSQSGSPSCDDCRITASVHRLPAQPSQLCIKMLCHCSTYIFHEGSTEFYLKAMTHHGLIAAEDKAVRLNRYVCDSTDIYFLV